MSSVVRPMPTTVARTVAITREESRQDALETARQLIGSTPSTAFIPVPTTLFQLHENCVPIKMRRQINLELK